MDNYSKPLVSVVMITYKHENYIAEAIKGVLMQEVEFDIELIIADDCSPDGTEVIVKTQCQTHTNGNWIKYHRHEKNIGMMPNFLYALNEAKGDYIALCEGDDYWTNTNKLALQIDVLKKSPEFSLCFHNSNIIHNNKIIGNTNNKSKSVFTTEDLFQDHFISTSSVVFRNILEYPDWFTKISSGDKAVLLLISLHGQFIYLSQNLSVYRSHPGGISNTHFGIKKVYEMSLLLNSFDDYTNNKYTKYCHESLLHEIETHLKQKQLETLKTNYLLKTVLQRLKFKLIFFFSLRHLK